LILIDRLIGRRGEFVSQRAGLLRMSAADGNYPFDTRTTACGAHRRDGMILQR
jgi:hypothetical protein